MTVDPLDVLAILEERPYLEEELVALFGAPADVVRVVLKGLFADRQVKRVGAERRWALAGYQAPVARPHLTKPARVQREVDDVDEDLDEAIDADADDLELGAVIDEEDEELPPAPPRQRGQTRLYPRTADAAGAPLRQASSKSPVTSEPAWWVGLTREQLAAQVDQRAGAMRGTKENLRVPLRILQ